MINLQKRTLTMAVLAIVTLQVMEGEGAAYVSDNPCVPNPCGVNAQCINRGRPVCTCLPGHRGNPITHCLRGECQDSSECPANKQCVNFDCVDVCAGACGINADCDVRGHVPVCSCPQLYTGDPFTRCSPIDPQSLCTATTCGRNTKCTVGPNLVPTCTCQHGYFGDPLTGCTHECERDTDCGSGHSCIDFTCKPACTANTCGDGSLCEVRNHRAVCYCPPGHVGDPQISCRAECLTNRDCPSDRPSCLGAKCVNPCLGVCGINADCQVRDNTAICSCPRHMTGDPFVSCRPFEKRDLCVPNPCGENAQCTPGYDRTGKDRPVCTCLPGYRGDPLSACRRGECSSNSECAGHQTCIDYTCRNVCTSQCGVNAECTSRDHTAICKCPSGFKGDPLVQCTALPQATADTSSRYYTRYGRFYY